jgi:uncharacterized protein
MRRYRDGSAEIDGFLSDYTWMTQGLLDLFEASTDNADLVWALRLQKAQDALFSDTHSGAYVTTETSSTRGADSTLLWKDHEAYDGAEPSANSVAAMNLIRFWQMTEDDHQRERALHVINAFGGQLTSAPESMPAMIAAYEGLSAQRRQVAIAGPINRSDTQTMLDLYWQQYLPNAVLLHAVGGAQQEELSQTLPLLADLHQQGGRATAYVCQNYICNLPTTDPQVMQKLLIPAKHD